MVVFFQSQVVEQGRGYTPGHVFGNNNLIYLEDGTLAATMYEVSDREAIAEEPCFE
jgi:formylmethanofuran dehydrogenase subunit E